MHHSWNGIWDQFQAKRDSGLCKIFDSAFSPISKFNYSGPDARWNDRAPFCVIPSHMSANHFAFFRLHVCYSFAKINTKRPAMFQSVTLVTSLLFFFHPRSICSSIHKRVRASDMKLCVNIGVFSTKSFLIKLQYFKLSPIKGRGGV